MKVRITNPQHMRAKYSGKPNRKAIRAKGGAISIRATTLKVPPMKDPKALIPSAGPARPRLAI